MTLEEKIKEQAKKCGEAADVCLEVGNPFFNDAFEPMLKEVANYALAEARAALTQLEV